MHELQLVGDRPIDLANITRQEAKALTFIVAALTLGRPVQAAEIVGVCGRVAWLQYMPLDSGDPYMPVVVGLGGMWHHLIREWINHLGEARRMRWELEEWANQGKVILNRIGQYVSESLSPEEARFLMIRLWLQWASAGELDVHCPAWNNETHRARR